MTATPPPPSSGLPPAMPASDPTAVVGLRIGAWFIDAVIGGLVVFVVVLATFTNTQFESSITAELQCDVINAVSDDLCIQSGSTVYVGTGSDIGVMFLAWVSAAVVLTIVIPAFTGWSPGKRLLGLRIVNQETFELAGVGPNLVRGLLWIVDGFGYITGPLVGGIAMASSDGKRRVGDMAAKTLVVKAEHVGRPVPVRNVNALGGPSVAPTYVPGAPRSAPTYVQPGSSTAPPPPFAPAPPPVAAPPVAPPPTSAPTGAPPPPSGPAAGAPPVAPTPAPTSPPVATPPVFPPPAPGDPAPPTGPLSEHQPPVPADEADRPAPVPDAMLAEPDVPAEPHEEDTDGPSPIEAGPAPDATPQSPVEAEPAPDPAPTPPEPTPFTTPAPPSEQATAPTPPVPVDTGMPAEPPAPAARPGVDAPMWDDARDTYIQWDPELGEWMMWSEAGGRWVPISR